jgi:hypothetical protein
MHSPDCSYRLGLACSCGSGDHPQSEDALFMQALLTGWIGQSLNRLTDPEDSPLTQPVRIERIDPSGIILLRLASGMLASIAVHVE